MIDCPHGIVKIYWRLWAMETSFEPGGYIRKVQCLQCGEWLDDVPEEAEVRE